MTKEANKIYWTAIRHSAYLDKKCSESRSLRAAVYAARDYVNRQHEWSGEVYYYTADGVDSGDYFRYDERGWWTNNKWETVFSDK